MEGKSPSPCRSPPPRSYSRSAHPHPNIIGIIHDITFPHKICFVQFKVCLSAPPSFAAHPGGRCGVSVTRWIFFSFARETTRKEAEPPKKKCIFCYEIFIPRTSSVLSCEPDFGLDPSPRLRRFMETSASSGAGTGNWMSCLLLPVG